MCIKDASIFPFKKYNPKSFVSRNKGERRKDFKKVFVHVNYFFYGKTKCNTEKILAFRINIFKRFFAYIFYTNPNSISTI